MLHRSTLKLSRQPCGAQMREGKVSLPVVCGVAYALLCAFCPLNCHHVHAAVNYEEPAGAPPYDLPVFNQLILRAVQTYDKSGSNVPLDELLPSEPFPMRIVDSGLVWSQIFRPAYTATNPDVEWLSIQHPWATVGSTNVIRMSRTGHLT